MALGYQTSLDAFNRIEIILTMFCNHIRTQLEAITRKICGYSLNIQKLNNAFLYFLSLRFFFKILRIYFYRGGREGEREGEKHQCVVASHLAPSGDLDCNPGLRPDWELNW